MKLKRKQIGVGLILVGLVLFISPNFLSIFGVGTNFYPFYCDSPQYSLQTATKGIQYTPLRVNGFQLDGGSTQIQATAGQCPSGYIHPSPTDPYCFKAIDTPTILSSSLYSIPPSLTSATYIYSGIKTQSRNTHPAISSAELRVGTNTIALNIPEYAITDTSVSCSAGACLGYWDCNAYNTLVTPISIDITSLLKPFQGQTVSVDLVIHLTSADGYATQVVYFINNDSISIIGTDTPPVNDTIIFEPPVLPPWVPPITPDTPSGQFNLLAFAFIAIGGFLVVRK